jgi:hypothetical protein
MLQTINRELAFGKRTIKDNGRVSFSHFSTVIFVLLIIIAELSCSLLSPYSLRAPTHTLRCVLSSQWL